MVEKLIPEGNAGDTDHEVAAPPVFEGDNVVIAEFTVPFIDDGV